MNRKKYNHILSKFIKQSLQHLEDIRYGQFIQNYVYPHYEGYGHTKMFNEEPKETIKKIKKRLNNEELLNILKEIEKEFK